MLDDLQMYLSLKVDIIDILHLLPDGICAVKKCWNHISNFWEKEQATIDINVLTFRFSDTEINLGVIFDKDLKFNKEVDLIVKSKFYHCCVLAKVKPLLNQHVDLKKAINAFISSIINYCNPPCVCVFSYPSTGFSWFRMWLHIVSYTSRLHSSLYWQSVHFRLGQQLLLFVLKLSFVWLYCCILRSCVHGKSQKSPTQFLINVQRHKY